MKNGDCLHLVLFGTFNESRYFLGDYRDSFDLIGFNANIIAYAPEGMAAFISQLKKKSYFVDPQTHAFQQPLKTVMTQRDGEWVLKKSIQKLSEHYGSSLKDNAGKTPIVAGSFSDDIINVICSNVLSFEFDIIQNASQKLDVKDFLKFSEVELRPEFLVPPYFCLEPDNLEHELEDNIKFINESKKIMDSQVFSPPKPLFAEIVLSREVLFDPQKLEKVLEQYGGCGSDGFLIWIDDFSEVSVSETALMKYKGFLANLGKSNKPIIAMHGSYFSIALAGEAHKCLAGVGHGIEYGEHRPVVPVGGGVPLAKFYFPKFHQRVDYDPDAENILVHMHWLSDRETYFDEVCDCEMCKRIIKADVASGFHQYGETKISEKDGKAYPTAQAMDKSRRHYLKIKTREYDFCRSSPISDIIADLEKSSETASRIKSPPFDHLKKWIKVLGS